MNYCRVLLMNILALFMFCAPVYAGDFSFIRGGENVISLFKIILILAAITGVVMEICKKGNVVLMIAIVALSAVLFYVAEPDKMKKFGQGVLGFISTAVSIIDGNYKKAPVGIKEYNSIKNITK